MVHQRVSDLLNLELVEACAVCSFASISKPADADLVEVRDVLPHSSVGLELRVPRVVVVRVLQSTTCPVAVAHTVVLCRLCRRSGGGLVEPGAVRTVVGDPNEAFPVWMWPGARRASKFTVDQPCLRLEGLRTGCIRLRILTLDR